VALLSHPTLNEHFTMTKTVFISYQRQQETQIKELVATLESHYDVWYDQKLKVGQNWWEEILNHIESMEIVILALSTSYLRSEACQREWKYARDLNKTIIPLRVDETLQYESVPEDIRRLQISPYSGKAIEFQKLTGEMDAAPVKTPPARMPQRPDAPMDVPPPPAPIDVQAATKPSRSANRTLLLGGAAVVVVLVIIIAVVLSQTGSKPPAIVGTVGAFDMTLIYGGTDSLTLKLNADSHLAGLTLETPGKTDLITDHFTTLASSDFIAKSGTCLRFTREGTDPSMPLGCKESLSVSLPDSAIFWYSNAAYQPITVTRAGLTIGVRCEPADGFGRCDFKSAS
jgi:hypothetical protein